MSEQLNKVKNVARAMAQLRGTVSQHMVSALAVVACCLSVVAVVDAQQGPPPAGGGGGGGGGEVQRIRGTIQSVQDKVMTLRDRDGKTLHLTLPDNLSVQQMLPYQFANLKAGDIVGSTAMPAGEHRYTSLEVRKFPGTEGPPANQRESNLKSGSILTNGRVVSIDTKAQPKRLILAVNDTQYEFLVADSTPVATYAAGDVSMFKPGVNVYLHASQTGADEYRVASATVGSKDMPTPPQ